MRCANYLCGFINIENGADHGYGETDPEGTGDVGEDV